VNLRILGVSGSLRTESFNTRLLAALPPLAPDGMQIDIFDGLGDIPLYNQDNDAREGGPEPVERWRTAIKEADGLLIVSPEYNSSIPGVVKNAIDWASRPVRESALTNKTVAVVGASTGQFGAMWAQADLRKILGTAGARVVGDELPVTRAHEKFDRTGRLLDAELYERLRLTLETLGAEAIPTSVENPA
jgi:chromate reductase